MCELQELTQSELCKLIEEEGAIVSADLRKNHFPLAIGERGAKFG
jgi:hypothetical protein